MTKPKARTNSFNGERAAKAQSPERIALVAYLLDNPGSHTYAQLIQATGYSTHIVHSRIQSARDDGEVVNTARNGAVALWQHCKHYKPVRPADIVSRRDPICNAGMPNGSRSYWAKQMVAFNASPRAA